MRITTANKKSTQVTECLESVVDFVLEHAEEGEVFTLAFSDEEYSGAESLRADIWMALLEKSTLTYHFEDSEYCSMSKLFVTDEAV